MHGMPEQLRAAVTKPLLVMLLLALAPYGVRAAPVHDWGFLVYSGTDLHGASTVQALGPVVERREGPGTALRHAIRPFWVRERDDGGRDIVDVLWPVASVTRWQGQTTWRFLTVFGVDYDREDPGSRNRTWMLPFVFWGRNEAGERYAALFPLGGRIDGFLGRDVSFVLFPLYSHSRINDVETHNVLWPLVSRTTGKGLYRFRIFPFYGRSVREGKADKTFVLWPFWNSARYEYPGSRGSGYVLFPFWGHVKLEDQETWMIAPPFIRRSVGPKGTEGYYPWPFVQVSSGKVDKLYVWPLFGRKREGNATRSFWLWPLVWHRHEVDRRSETGRFRVFPLFYTQRTRALEAPQPVLERYVSVWPLGSYLSSSGDCRRVRCLDLWPFRNTPPIERNLAPWWTLYRFERNAGGWANECLWGMLRWGHEAEGARYGSVFPVASWSVDPGHAYREWDFLKGLVGYRRSETRREYRVLYVLRWRDRP